MVCVVWCVCVRVWLVCVGGVCVGVGVFFVCGLGVFVWVRVCVLCVWCVVSVCVFGGCVCGV